jgi:hypothetical protein
MTAVIKTKDIKKCPEYGQKKQKRGYPASGPNSLVPFKTVILLGLSQSGSPP